MASRAEFSRCVLTRRAAGRNSAAVAAERKVSFAEQAMPTGICSSSSSAGGARVAFLFDIVGVFLIGHQ